MRNRITETGILSLLIPVALLACQDGHTAAAVEEDVSATDEFAHTEESPFVKVFRPGERETTLYVWTRDATGEGTDFVAVVDADPESTTYGEIISTAPTGSTNNEAHHFSYNADASRIFAAGMFSNRMFIYDIGDDPTDLRLARTVDLDATGYNGPHTPYAVPGGVLVAMMGQPDGNSGALIMLDDDGDLVEVYPAEVPRGRPAHLYDVSIDPGSNLMLATAFTHVEQLERGAPDPHHSGREVVVWDWESGGIIQVAEVDPGPSVLRRLRTPGTVGAYLPSLFNNSVWLWSDGDSEALDFERVLELAGDAMPVDIRISPDDRFLFVSLWGAGSVQQYDITDPRQPRLVDEVEVPQVNMIRLSPDGERLYATNSITSLLDGEVEFGAWLFRVGPDGMQRDERFDPDFENFSGGRAGPHDMLLR